MSDVSKPLAFSKLDNATVLFIVRKLIMVPTLTIIQKLKTIQTDLMQIWRLLISIQSKK